ncbi:MAG: 4Fe-4S binding protein [Bacteroidota bacterium]
MKAIRWSGLFLFLISLGIFFSMFFMSKYTLTEEIFNTYIKAEHQEILAPKLSEIYQKPFSLSIPFVNYIDEVIKHYNADQAAKQNWDKRIFDDYGAILTRASAKGVIIDYPGFFFFLTFILGTVGSLMFILPAAKLNGPPGIKNNGIFFNALNNRGWLGILIGGILILFYILLYFFPAYITNWIIMMDPVKQLFIPDSQASQWFLYGFLYCFAVLIMGIRKIIKYRHNKYKILQTLSVTFFQLAIAFILPEILLALNQPYFDFKNIWPLDYDFFYTYQLDTFLSSGTIGMFMLVWGILLIVLGVPIMTYFFGKRWYCSWVCGCGALAETAGDPFRQLSDKSLKAWKIERWLVHGVLVFAVIMTVGVLYTYFTGSYSLFGLDTYNMLQKPYGFLIGSIFSGVVGTGFYPLMGNRVWCRFGCPLAAYLGIVQRFKSRFRITTNGGQCISCGNCSTYCEMGIDVRWYAQRGQNIVRSSCVGCGVCSAVCPRGVLKLENAEEDSRFGQAILTGNESFKNGV